MIKQQYYTRERRGIYSPNPGYNTVAKSEALDEAFVKNLLQEYCFYEIPLELLNENDYSKFPKAHTCINIPSGELVLGSSCFIPKDYEGKRSTYFTHNYVVSESEKDIFIKNPEKIMYASGFNYSFDMEKSSILEEVKTIEMNSSEDTFSSLSGLLKELKIDGKTFKQILMACFMSVSKNKKIYIILDVDITLISKYAKALLKYLYTALPYEVRRKIGFITYAKDAKSKEYINLQFLPKGALKNIGTEVSSGYIFDFALKRFLNEGLNIEKHKYLDFIWQNIENKKQLNLYMDTAEELICSNKLNINEQDELCEFFQINNSLSLEAYRNFKAEKSRHREELLQEEFKCFIEKLDIEKMSIGDIIKIKLLSPVNNSENYEIIYLMQQAMSVKSFSQVAEVSKVISRSPYKSMVEVFISKLYKEEINQDNYLILIGGFSNNVMGVIKFIYENKGVDTAREFLVWLCRNHMNMDVEAIKKAIIEYINLYDNKIFKDRITRNLLMKESRGQLRESLKKEEYKRAKGIKKIFLKWR